MTTETPTETPDGPGTAPHVADSHDRIRVRGARENNLRDVSVDLPKRRLTAVTGVSGSGKSTLVNDILATVMANKLNGARHVPGRFQVILQEMSGSYR